jgi:hypothetical protein
MTSMVLRDSTLEYLTPSVNALLVVTINQPDEKNELILWKLSSIQMQIFECHCM